MDVGEIAKEWYERNEPEGALAKAITDCFFRGVIIRRPGFLLMGETAFWDGQTVTFAPREQSNCWFVHFCAATQMSTYDIAQETPFPMEFVVFKRRGRIHAAKWDRLYARDLGSWSRNYVTV